MRKNSVNFHGENSKFYNQKMYFIFCHRRSRKA